MKFITIIISVFFLNHVTAQQSDTAFNALIQQEFKMFEAICKNDSTYLQQLIREDYVSINADGKIIGKAVTIKNLSKFKGASFKLFDKKIRIYDNTAVINGRAKFYFRSLLVAEVLYTEIWKKENGEWRYASWQGTMTGWPSHYQVMVTLISIFFLWLIFIFVFKNKRKKTF